MKTMTGQLVMVAIPLPLDLSWIRGGKALGLDGFNAIKKKRAWPVVGEDVLDAILSFFYSGSLLREVNKTILALVSKIPNATKLSNYRPYFMLEHHLQVPH